MSEIRDRALNLLNDDVPATWRGVIRDLLADNEAKQALIENFKLDDLMDIFKGKLEEEIVVTLQTGIHRGLLEAAGIAEKVCREFASPKIGYACKTAIINKVASEI